MQEQRQQQQSPSPTPTQQQQSSGSGSLRRMMRVNSPKMCTPIEEKLEQNLKVSDYRTLLLSLSLARALSIFLSLGLSLTCALRARAFLRLEQLVSVCEGKGGEVSASNAKYSSRNVTVGGERTSMYSCYAFRKERSKKGMDYYYFFFIAGK